MQLILRGLFCHFLTDRATWKQWWIFRKVVEPLSLPIALCAKISRPSPCHHPLNSNEAVGLLRPCVPNCPTFARFSRDLNLRQRSGTAIVHWNAESKHTFGSWSKSSGDRFPLAHSMCAISILWRVLCRCNKTFFDTSFKLWCIRRRLPSAISAMHQARLNRSMDLSTAIKCLQRPVAARCFIMSSNLLISDSAARPSGSWMLTIEQLQVGCNHLNTGSQSYGLVWQIEMCWFTEKAHTQ